MKLFKPLLARQWTHRQSGSCASMLMHSQHGLHINHEKIASRDELEGYSLASDVIPRDAKIFQWKDFNSSSYTNQFSRFINFNNMYLEDIACYSIRGFVSTVKIRSKYKLVVDWNKYDAKHFPNAGEKVVHLHKLIGTLSKITGFAKNKAEMRNYDGIADCESHGFMAVTENIEDIFGKLGLPAASPFIVATDHSVPKTQSLRDVFKMNDKKYDFSSLDEKQRYLANSDCLQLQKIEVDEIEATVIARGKDLCPKEYCNGDPDIAILQTNLQIPARSMVLADLTKWDDNEIGNIKQVYSVGSFMQDKLNTFDLKGNKVDPDKLLAAYGTANEKCVIGMSKMFIDKVFALNEKRKENEQDLTKDESELLKRHYFLIEKKWKSIVKRDKDCPNVLGCHLLPLDNGQSGSFLAYDKNRVFGVHSGTPSSNNYNSFSWVNQTMIDFINNQWKDEWYQEIGRAF